MAIFAGNISGSSLTGSLSYTSLTSVPTGIVSSSTQIAASIPTGTVSSSAQIDYNSITNKLSGVVSSSTQVAPLLPSETVSSSAQVDYNSITNKLSGVVSSSAQVAPLLPNGTVSSSTQTTANLPIGTVSSSAQYPGWVTSSAQVLLNTVSGTTFSNNAFYFPTDLRVDGTLTAQQINTEYVSSSVIYESGSSKFGDTTDDVMSVTGSILVLGGRISGSMTGMFSSSTQVDYNSITNKLSDVVSSSAQFNALTGTSASFALTASYVASAGGAAAGTISSSTQFNNITDPFTGSFTGSFTGTGVITNAELLFYGNL